MPAPEYDYYEERSLSGEVVVSGRVCRHVNKEPVEAVISGEVVAYLCLDCPKSFYTYREG